MAESGLSVGAPDLRAELGRFLGWSGTSGNWNASQLAEINLLMNSGVRRVYYPRATREAPSLAGYEWTFLKPWTTLTTADGTADYDAPDDFGRIVGDVHYPDAEYQAPLVSIPASQILEYRVGAEREGQPSRYATRWKATTGSTGQRQEFLLWPTPDDAWVLRYQYEAYNGPLSDSFPYPLGGMKLAELYIESCLAVAESRYNDEEGLHHKAYIELLVDCVQRDKKVGAKHFGQMGHKAREGHGNQTFRRGYGSTTYPITYKGSPI